MHRIIQRLTIHYSLLNRYRGMLALCFVFLLPLASLSQEGIASKSVVIEKSKFAVNRSKKLKRQLEQLPIFKNSFSGFCIYDVKKGKYILEQNANRYFTPASNTKLFTFYAGLKYLKKHLPALKYTVKGDSLIFWGLANPCFLHYDEPDSIAFQFLRNTTKKLYFSVSNYKDSHFGHAWSWDDYDGYYSAEKTSFPVYGNILRINADTMGTMEIQLPYFKDSLINLPNVDSLDHFWATRDLYRNSFPYVFPKKISKNRERDIPLKTSPTLIVKLLSDTLKKKVVLIDRNFRSTDTLHTLYTMRMDSLYKPMLRRSDNFYAECILLMCADSLFNGDSLNTRNIIERVAKEQFNDLTDKPRWVDGSGLSRHNLFTPKSIVELLLKLLEVKSQDATSREELFDLFPSSGSYGTLKHRFTGNAPFVFAKTGTLSNNHNLSGYLVTKTGKLLVFSYMNNHYRHKTNFIKQQTDKILTDFFLYYK